MYRFLPPTASRAQTTCLRRRTGEGDRAVMIPSQPDSLLFISVKTLASIHNQRVSVCSLREIEPPRVSLLAYLDRLEEGCARSIHP
jgi:hypothetical protein